jgi:hypothetical protein
MAWGDMTMFSDPSRNGLWPDVQPYPKKAISPWLAAAVLVLGLVPSVLAIVGFAVSIGRPVLWPLALTFVLTSAVYVAWFVAQEFWALKTKYILFLLPIYLVYATLGWRWLGSRSWLLDRAIYSSLIGLLIAAHLYLLQFAWL